MGTPILTLDEAKSTLSIRAESNTHDTRLAIVLSGITDLFEDSLGIVLAQQEVTEFFNTRRTRSTHIDLYGSSETGLVDRASRQSFILKGTPIDTVADFTVRYDPDLNFYEEDTPLVEKQDYHIDKTDGRLTLFIGTGNYTKSLMVRYTAGIVVADGSLSTNAPAPLKQAAMFQLGYEWARMKPDNMGRDSDIAMAGDKSKSPSARWNVSQGICQEAQGLLRPYKRPVMGRG